MKKIISVSLLLLSLCFAAFAQQSIQSDKIDTFQAIELIGNIAVELTQTEGNPAIDIKLNNTDINKLDWGVKDGVLTVRLKPNVNNSSGANADVKLSYNKLSRLKISGANVSIKETLNGNIMDIDMSAGATLGGGINVKDLSLKVAGNSAANLSGHTKYYTLHAGGRSKVDTRSLDAQNANVSASSAAEVYVFADERLELSAETGATIYYKGEPEILRTSSKMMGGINSIGK